MGPVKYATAMKNCLVQLNKMGAKATSFSDLTESAKQIVVRYQQDNEEYAVVISPPSKLHELAMDVDAKLTYWMYKYNDKIFIFVLKTHEEAITAIEAAVLKRIFKNGISHGMRFLPRNGSNHPDLTFPSPNGVKNYLFLITEYNIFRCDDLREQQQLHSLTNLKSEKCCRAGFGSTVFQNYIRFEPGSQHICGKY